MAQGSITIADASIKGRHIAANAGIPATAISLQTQKPATVPLTSLRTWDALATNLPATPATDDLGLITGTWGTDAPYIGTGDLKNLGATTRRAGFIFPLPLDYEDGEPVTILVSAGMKTTVASTTATVDIEAWRLDFEDGTLGAADICATTAQNINSLTADTFSFTITPTTLLAGDQLYVRLSMAVNDTATGTAVIGAVYTVQVLSDIR